ncbi:hypothetical protein D6779_01155 [Candidatus Parcubacteria bacterium]|nr:MAG: hypothetical protein D6779_01155 [Candidatus Parcubacteria bacterium]
MVKIFVEKGESVSSLAEKIAALKDDEVVLVIPKGSSLKESAGNFQLLKREAENKGKRLIIESVDDAVLALAQTTGIESLHPLFQQDKFRHSLSDIRPAGRKKRSAASTPRKGRGGRSTPEAQQESVAQSSAAQREIDEDNAMPVKGSAEDALPPISRRPLAEVAAGESALEAAERRRRFLRIPAFLKKKWVLTPLVFVALLGASLWGFSKYFGTLEVTLRFERIAWGHEADFVAAKNAKEVDVASRTVPAEVFTTVRDISKTFPASGKKFVSRKAVGTVTIYNAYSSRPQELVATTRFMTPDGKIFRLDHGVTVPGAEVKDGKIIPSSIEAPVTADKPGEEYNVGPIPRLSIPGFKGSPKYHGFYGELKRPTHGGFRGEKAVPTEEDIRAAKKQVREILEEALKTNIFDQIPKGFRVLPGASEITILELSVNEDTDAEGNFGVFGKAKKETIAFRDADIKNALGVISQELHPDMKFDTIDITYSNIVPDFSKGTLSFHLKADATLMRRFDADELRRILAGKPLREVRSIVAKIDGVEHTKISIHPYWKNIAPENADRIKVIVE